MIEAKVDQKAIDRQLKLLAKYEGRTLQVRAQKAYLAGARLMVQPIRGRISNYGDVKTGGYRRKVRAQSVRLRSREMAAATVGPRSPHRHLLIRGHRIVTRGGVDTGRRTQPHPVVDEAYRQVGNQVRDFINERVLGLGERFMVL